MTMGQNIPLAKRSTRKARGRSRTRGETSECRVLPPRTVRATAARESSYPGTPLEEVGLSLENLAMRMLDQENRFELEGRTCEADVIAEWRREVRFIAEFVFTHRAVRPQCPLCPHSAQSDNSAKCKWHV